MPMLTQATFYKQMGGFRGDILSFKSLAFYPSPLLVSRVKYENLVMMLDS